MLFLVNVEVSDLAKLLYRTTPLNVAIYGGHLVQESKRVNIPE